MLDLKNDGKNQGPFGGLLVDVALQVHANLFLDDAPVGFFLGVGFLDGLHNHQSRAHDQFLAVVAHQTARHDFRTRITTSSISSSEPESTHTRPAVTGSRRRAPSSVNSIGRPSSTSRISCETAPS